MQVLSDENKRRTYDSYGQTNFGGKFYFQFLLCTTIITLLGDGNHS